MAQRRWFIAGVAAVAVLAVTAAWLERRSAPPVTAAADAATAAPPGLAPPMSPPLGVATSTRTGAPVADPLLNPELLHLFKEWLGEAYAKDKVGMLAELQAKLDQRLPPAQRQRARALLGQYIDYANTLATLPRGEPGDAASMRRLLDARAAIRQRLFAADEIEGLFGSDERFDRYTVAKLEAEQTLTGEQRRAALSQIEATLLSPEERHDRAAAALPQAVADQTAALDARGATPAERLELRSRQYGADAAQRLAALDVQEQDWQDRLSRYAALDAAARVQARDQLFTPQEVQRLDGALALRATRR